MHSGVIELVVCLSRNLIIAVRMAPAAVSRRRLGLLVCILSPIIPGSLPLAHQILCHQAPGVDRTLLE